MEFQICDYRDAEFAVFSEDRFGYVTPGKTYQIFKNKGGDYFVRDNLGRDNYGVLIISKKEYFKTKYNTYEGEIE